MLWISRYAAGGNLFLDLEAVEDLTAHPERALRPAGRPAAGGVPVRLGRPRPPSDGVLHSSEAAPERCRGCRSMGPPPGWRSRTTTTSACAARIDDDEIVVIGRRGGPEFLDSELARLGHLTGLALSIARPDSRHEQIPPRAENRCFSCRTIQPVRRARAGTPGSPGRSSSGTPRRSARPRPRAPTTRRARRRRRSGRRRCAARARPGGRPAGGPGSCGTTRVLRGAALGRDRGVHAVVLDPHDRVLAQLAALRAARGDHDDRERVVVRTLPSAPPRGLVLSTCLRTQSACWARSSPVQCHARHNTGRRGAIPGAAIACRHERDRRGVRDLRPERVGRRARLRGPDRPHLPPREGARHRADRLRPARRAQRLPARTPSTSCSACSSTRAPPATSAACC